jgi:superfamily II DNA or RNA helicase
MSNITANKQVSYYYILKSEIIKEHFLKLGITKRHPRHRFAEHKTSHSAYKLHTIYKLYDTTELIALEKYVLAKTIDFIYDTADINNECRYKLDPESICKIIIDYLEKNLIHYDVLELGKLDDELDETTNYPSEYVMKEKYFSNYADCVEYVKRKETQIKLRDYQIELINKALLFYNLNHSGILNWACGLGKTLTSIFLLIEYAKHNRVINVLIGVPSVAILKQWFKVILQIDYLSHYQIVAITGSEIPDILTTTDTDTIYSEYVKNNIIIITTYISSHLVSDYQFDFAIFDEVHHLAGVDTADARGYKKILSSKRAKTLSLSATLKDTEINGNFDVNIFGDIIDTKSIHWAITNKFITDYRLLVMESNAYVVNNILPNSKYANLELYLAAFSVLYGMYNRINNMSHTFIYTNDIKDSTRLLKCIKKLLLVFKLDSLFYGKVDSYEADIQSNLDNFRSAKFGILICVYMLGEGFDDPLIDSVCFSKSMISKIRSVQSLLRGNRLLASNPNKINTVIFPTADISDVYSSSFGALIDIIRNEDENIEEKMSFIKIDANSAETKTESPNDNLATSITHLDTTTNIKYKLFESKRMSPLDRFNYYANYNQQFKFRCITDYMKRAKLDSYHLPFIADPENEFILVWNKTTKWYGFLAIDCSAFPASKDLWKARCVELCITGSEDYEKKCIANNLPIDYLQYYNLTTSDLPWIKRKIKKYNSVL